MRLRLLALLAVLCAATPALAQPSDSLCTYATCALRVESGLFGTKIIRGAEGIPVGSSLSTAVAASPRALEYARLYERTRTPAFLSVLGGALLLAVASTPSDNGPFSLSDGARLGLFVGGLGLTTAGLHFTIRSQRAQSRAIWWYNRDLH